MLPLVEQKAAKGSLFQEIVHNRSNAQENALFGSIVLKERCTNNSPWIEEREVRGPGWLDANNN